MAQEDNQYYVNKMFSNETKDTSVEEKQEDIDPASFQQNCGGLSSDTDSGRTSFIGNSEKLRFIIVGMGLMGSGKSTGFERARQYCTLLNSAAARKPWETIEDGKVSHDYNIVNNQNYKRNVRNLFKNSEYSKFTPWTEAGWNSMSATIKTQFAAKMYDLYNTTRHGVKIVDSDKPNIKSFLSTEIAEKTRKDLTRKLNLHLETPGESRQARKRRIQEEFKNEPLKFSAEQKKKILNIKTIGGSAVTYRALRQAIIDGKNIEYEAIGTSFSTIKTIFDVIVESTKNCKDFVYIVLGVLNLCSIQDSYNRQLCRYFQDAGHFVKTLKAGNSWTNTKRWFAIDWGLGNNASDIIRNTPAPKLSIITTNQRLNQKLYNNIKELIQTCNQNSLDAETIYKGRCHGFGIDILLISHAPLNKTTDTIIATLPLSIRSQHLVKSTTGQQSIQNKKFYHNLVIAILDSLLKANPYGKNPRIQDKIQCSQMQGVPDEVSKIIDNLVQAKFSNKLKRKKELKALRKSGSQKIWTKSMGGRSRIRKRKTRRRKRKRKTRKRKRKTRRKRR